MEKLTNEQYWNRQYRGKMYSVAPKNSAITNFLDQYVKIAEKEEGCFEIGCCPCRYLAYIGLKGYTINGIDYTNELNAALLRWLKTVNVNIGTIERGDFFVERKKTHKKYELVYSLGFIEHFKNYNAVIKMHDEYVKKGGYLIITTPNYRGKINYLLHRIFNYENLKIHYLPSMQPDIWKSVLEDLNYEIEFCGYFGGLNYEPWNEKMNFVQSILWKIINNIQKLLKKIVKKESAQYSEFCGIVAKKKE